MIDVLSCLPGTWWAWGSRWWAIRKKSWAAYRLWEPRCCISMARVSRCDGRATTNRNRTSLEQCLGRSWDNCQSKRTSVMSDSSGCVQSEIIPLSLSEGLWSASLKGTKERKRAKKTATKKETTWTRWLPFLFILVFLEALTNSTTYQMARRTGFWLLRFFNLVNDFCAHHGLRFPLKRTKTTLSTLLWFHLLLFWLIFFPSATVACCGPSRSFSFFSSIWTWQQGKLLSKHRGNLLAADSKVLFVLTHAGLFELFAVTHVFLHVLLKWKWYPHVLVCSLQ